MREGIVALMWLCLAILSKSFVVVQITLPVSYWSASLILCSFLTPTGFVQAARNSDVRHVVVGVDTTQDAKNESSPHAQNMTIQDVQASGYRPMRAVVHTGPPGPPLTVDQISVIIRRLEAELQDLRQKPGGPGPPEVRRQLEARSAVIQKDLQWYRDALASLKPAELQSSTPAQSGAAKTQYVQSGVDKANAAATAEHREPDQLAGTLAMSDVDDTATCPKARSGEMFHDIVADVAGFDTCKGDHAMQAGEIYYGYGLLLYLLGIGARREGIKMTYEIVSANPFGTVSYYRHIEEYVGKVSGACKPRMEDLGGRHVPLKLNDVRHGKSYSSLRGHAYMAIRKLHSMLKEASRKDYDKVVWIGDTGQGDVCAGVCFIDPVLCAQRMPQWVALLQTTKTVHYEIPNAWITSGGRLKGMRIPERRYALFHQIFPDLYNRDPIVHECFGAAAELASQRKLSYFGLADETNRRQDYYFAARAAADMGLVDPVLVEAFWCYPRSNCGGDAPKIDAKLQDSVEKEMAKMTPGRRESYDGFSIEEWKLAEREGWYLKHKEDKGVETDNIQYNNATGYKHPHKDIDAQRHGHEHKK